MQALLHAFLIHTLCSKGTALPRSSSSSDPDQQLADPHDETCSKVSTWVDIMSPKSAQLFLEGNFDEIRLRYRVHGVVVGRGDAKVLVYVIK